jgi:hypothetical protein
MSTHKKDSQVLHVDYKCALESRPKRTSPRPNPTMIEMMYAPWNVLDARWCISYQGTGQESAAHITANMSA